MCVIIEWKGLVPWRRLYRTIDCCTVTTIRSQTRRSKLIRMKNTSISRGLWTVSAIVRSSLLTVRFIRGGSGGGGGGYPRPNLLNLFLNSFVIEHKGAKHTTPRWSSWMVPIPHNTGGFLKVCWRTPCQIKDGSEALMQYLEWFYEPSQLPISGKVANTQILCWQQRVLLGFWLNKDVDNT